jgi:hypothetical protein
MDELRNWIARVGRNTWNNWPKRAYERASYRQRLAAVEFHLRESLDLAPAGQVRIIALCAGDGRDVINVVGSHPRCHEVSAWLVEADGNSIQTGTSWARAAGLQDNVRFLHCDATSYATYLGIAPADILLVCGVWGHVPPEERNSVIDACKAICRPGGVVIWTRGVRLGMARLHEICHLFTPSTWEQVRLTVTSTAKWAVATHRLLESAEKLPTSGRIFHFRTAAG